jgi:Fungal N-terminal domain of STAND proteins
MAEALVGIAVASSIISVFQVSAQAVQLGWECVKLYQAGAPQGLDKLVEELTLLHGVLSTLESQFNTANAEENERSAVLGLLEHPGGPLSACSDALGQILKLFEELGVKKGVRSRVRAAFSATALTHNIDSLMDRVQRLKSLLLLALYSDQV